MPSIGQTWVLASIGAVVEMGILSTLKRLLMESNGLHEYIKTTKPYLLGTTYNPKRIHEAAISEPNPSRNPVNSQTRAPVNKNHHGHHQSIDNTHGQNR
jgi:hypothetical protein